MARAVLEHDLLISEVADYELRRELLRVESNHSLARLDELTRELSYVPMATATWRAAAKLWATLRRAGRVTAPPSALDADVLIAAQTLAEGATVVTPNLRHFDHMVSAFTWADVPLSQLNAPTLGHAPGPEHVDGAATDGVSTHGTTQTPR